MLGWEDPLEKGKATNSSILSFKTATFLHLLPDTKGNCSLILPARAQCGSKGKSQKSGGASLRVDSLKVVSVRYSRVTIMQVYL